jgi:hypothetical protein
MQTPEPQGRMPTPLNPPKPPSRWMGLLLSRRLWIVVGVLVVAALAIYAAVAVPVGPTSFSFSWSSSACGCQHTASTNHSFPDHAYVSLTFTSHYLVNASGNASEYVLVVTDPSGTVIVYADMEGGNLGTVGTATVASTFTTTASGSFEFTILGAAPPILPGITAWVNGTYHAPILSI